MTREKRDLPEAFFGDSQEEKDTVRTLILGVFILEYDLLVQDIHFAQGISRDSTGT